ncbi:diguanylate cyclase [Hoeflea sp.]|uniref:diguanylate cyclase n=1 Tax=Hoeflea sp. TaxID=1940281 RepID=UPI003B52A54D
MPIYPLPNQEHERLEKLRSYHVLDSLPEESYDRVVRLAGNLFDVPFASVALVEGDRLWFKSHIGFPDSEMNREFAFCNHTICGEEVFVIEDASRDPDFCNNPYVAGAPHLRFYAGAPLRTAEGLNLGTLAVIDTRPRTVTDAEKKLLEDLASMVMDALDMRLLIERADAAESRFADAIESLPNGFALYDKQDRLVHCNERYRQVYSHSARFIVPGATFEEILRYAVSKGQFPEAAGKEEAWIAKRLEQHRNPGEPIEQRLPGDQWLRVQERRTSEGGIVGFRFDITKLKHQERELARLAWTDSLTGALNRHRFLELAEKEIDRTARHHKPASLLVLDADHFKQINDRDGHAAGDEVLKGIVERFKRTLRSHDIIGRIGGEEFGILLPEIGADDAVKVAAKLCNAISELPFAFEGQLLRATISIGVATHTPGDHLHEVMRRADMALYEAKAAGRNCLVLKAA